MADKMFIESILNQLFCLNYTNWDAMFHYFHTMLFDTVPNIFTIRSKIQYGCIYVITYWWYVLKTCISLHFLSTCMKLETIIL